MAVNLEPVRGGGDDELAPETVERSRRILATESRSFHWASFFLPAERRDEAAVVYAFCRIVDDVADEMESPEEARAELDRLERELDGEQPRPVVEGFRRVARKRGIDLECARELICGVRSDLECVRVRDDRELIRYCYRVAGTVGLMMSPLLGVEESRARPHAVDLGVGMQITNICRDVLEDAQNGRVYLPQQRLVDAGTSAGALLEGRADRDAVRRVVRELLAVADRYYESGRAGMRFIPRRSRLAIEVASRVYRAIGGELRRRDCDPMRGRAVVGLFGKLREVGAAVGSFLNPFGDASGPDRRHDGRLHRALQGLPGANPPAGELDAA